MLRADRFLTRTLQDMGLSNSSPNVLPIGLHSLYTRLWAIMNWSRPVALLAFLFLTVYVQQAGAVPIAKTYGGTGSDSALSVGVSFATIAGVGGAGPYPAFSAGLVFSGSTSSFGNPFGDTWVVRLDSSG